MHRTTRPLPLGKRVASYRSPTPNPLALGLWLGLSLGVILQTASLWLRTDGLWALAALATPILGAFTWSRQVPRRVDLYQHGIDYSVGRRHEYVFWSEIQEVYQTPLYRLNRRRRELDQPDAWMYRLRRRDGRWLRLYQLESVRTLGQRIQQQLLRRQLPAALDAFHSGYTIRFGHKLAISLDGVRLRGKPLSWYEIAEITLDETTELQVIERHRPAVPRRLAITQVPNLLLLDQILRASQQAASPDPLDVAPQRGALFDETPNSLAGEERLDDRDDPDESLDRPRQPK